MLALACLEGAIFKFRDLKEDLEEADADLADPTTCSDPSAKYEAQLYRCRVHREMMASVDRVTRLQQEHAEKRYQDIERDIEYKVQVATFQALKTVKHVKKPHPTPPLVTPPMNKRIRPTDDSRDEPDSLQGVEASGFRFLQSVEASGFRTGGPSGSLLAAVAQVFGDVPACRVDP